MVGDLQFRIVGNHDVALRQQVFHPADHVRHDLARVDPARRVLQHGLMRLEIRRGVEVVVFRPIVGGDVAGLGWEREENVGIRQPLPGRDGVP